jgi:hypothetical protein
MASETSTYPEKCRNFLVLKIRDAVFSSTEPVQRPKMKIGRPTLAEPSKCNFEKG